MPRMLGYLAHLPAGIAEDEDQLNGATIRYLDHIQPTAVIEAVRGRKWGV